MSHIEYNERRSIERYLKKKRGVRWIARALDRSPSTVSEEIRCGSVKGIYRADKAQKKAERRRRSAKQKCLKVAKDPDLKQYVIYNLEDNQSPEGIAGRIKYVDTHIPYASHKAIYNFIASSHGGPLEHHLYSKRVKKKSGPKRGSMKASDKTKVSIEKRPKKANKRLEFGHFEGDFIESGKDGTGSLLVLVERMTRYPFIVYTEDKTTLTINELIAGILRDVPVRSITLDNDISFQKHEELSEMIDAVVYFTHPYTSSDIGNNWLELLRDWILDIQQANFLSENVDFPKLKAFVQKIGTNYSVRDKTARFTPAPPWGLVAQQQHILSSAAASRRLGGLLSSDEVRCCAGEKNRTPDRCLEGSCFTTKLHPRMVSCMMHQIPNILSYWGGISMEAG